MGLCIALWALALHGVLRVGRQEPGVMREQTNVNSCILTGGHAGYQESPLPIRDVTHPQGGDRYVPEPSSRPPLGIRFHRPRPPLANSRPRKHGCRAAQGGCAASIALSRPKQHRASALLRVPSCENPEGIQDCGRWRVRRSCAGRRGPSRAPARCWARGEPNREVPIRPVCPR
jgi:hypothetical protein